MQLFKEAGVRATIAYLARAPGSRKENKDEYEIRDV